jgi:SEL1 protein
MLKVCLSVHLCTLVVMKDFSAARALKQALATLTTLTAHPPSYTHDSHFISSSSSLSNSFLSYFLPNLQGQGPLGSFLRIALKLHYKSWLSRLTSSKESSGYSGSKRKVEELRLKAVKVVDLLQHSAELGNMDALYTLARISLVRLFIYTACIWPSFRIS